MWYDAIQSDTPDWGAIEASFPYAAEMKQCQQDPSNHGEGDVWTHTRMVADKLVELGFDTPLKRMVALFHDVQKPATRTDVEGKIGFPSHARRGAKVAWYDLWERGYNLDSRLFVYAMILWHQRVFHMWDHDDQTRMRLALEFSEIGGDWNNLIDFARADNLGRICADQKDRDDSLLILQIMMQEMGLCEDDNGVFPDSHSRMFYFEKEGRHPSFVPPPPKGSRVTVMSGLPGVGKDTWVGKNLPGVAVLSGDTLREEMGIEPGDNQGTLVQALREQARVYLRRQEPFVWNGTNLTRQMRQSVIGLCRSYDAHVSVIAFDKPLKTILTQNKQRDRNVPEDVIKDLARKWEPPFATEAHSLTWVD